MEESATDTCPGPWWLGAYVGLPVHMADPTYRRGLCMIHPGGAMCMRTRQGLIYQINQMPLGEGQATGQSDIDGTPE